MYRVRGRGQAYVDNRVMWVMCVDVIFTSVSLCSVRCQCQELGRIRSFGDTEEVASKACGNWN